MLSINKLFVRMSVQVFKFLKQKIFSEEARQKITTKNKTEFTAGSGSFIEIEQHSSFKKIYKKSGMPSCIQNKDSQEKI